MSEEYTSEPVESSETPVRKQAPIWEDMLILMMKIGMILLAGFLVFTFVYGIVRVSNMEMSPAIKEGDLVIYYRIGKNYIQSDLVAVEVDGKIVIGRVVAQEGDTVDITADGLLVNGSLQQETDIQGETLPYEEGITFPVTLKEGEVFLLADNREGAEDSRIFGPVRISDTLGKVMTIIRTRHL